MFVDLFVPKAYFHAVGVKYSIKCVDFAIFIRIMDFSNYSEL